MEKPIPRPHPREPQEAGLEQEAAIFENHCLGHKGRSVYWREQAGIPEAPPPHTHKFLLSFLTAGWVSARQSSISTISSGLSPRSAERTDMRTEWCRASCRAEGCWEEALLFSSSPLLRGSVPSPPAHPPCEQGTVLLQHRRALAQEPPSLAPPGLLWQEWELCGETSEEGWWGGHSRVGYP